MELKKVTGVILIIVAVLAVVIGGLFAAYKLCFDPHRGAENDYIISEPLDKSLSVSEVREDIDFVMKRVRERHPAWLEKENDKVDATEAKYKEEISKLEGSGKDSLTVLEEWQIISRILCPLGDGHTYVDMNPEKFYFIDDLTKLNEYGVPVKINGEPVEDVIARYRELSNCETEEYIMDRFTSEVLFYEKYLRWVGVDTSDGVTYTFDTDEGTVDCNYKIVPYDDVKGMADEDDYLFSYHIDEEAGLGIFVLKHCRNTFEYRQALYEFFEAVNEKNIGNIALDLRGNGGGTSSVAVEFAGFLGTDGLNGMPQHVRYGNLLLKFDHPVFEVKRKEPVFGGNIYVLTNTSTFSSAMDFAMLLKDNGYASIVGEASGNRPDSYGDDVTFTVPNSKLTLEVSFKRWFRVDRTQPGDVLSPDYPCRSQDALDKVYELIKGE